MAAIDRAGADTTEAHDGIDAHVPVIDEASHGWPPPDDSDRTSAVADMATCAA